MPATKKGPLSKVFLRKLTRAIFGISGALRTKSETDNEGLPWQIVKILEMIAKQAPPEVPPPVEMRQAYRLLTKPYHVDDAAMAAVQDYSVRDGLTMRLYRPHGVSVPSPALVYYHGGGCVIGDLETHDTLCRFFAAKAGIPVIATDYRLAPEHRYPAQLEDAIGAYNWVRANAEMLGIDPARIGVGGDSAGGLMTVALAREAQTPSLDEKPDGMPAFLFTIYPAVDWERETESYNSFTEGLLLTKGTMEYFFGHTLPEKFEPRPIRPDDPATLPPTFVLTVHFDPLRDEGIAFAKELEAAGTDVTHHHHPRLLHEFVSMGGVVPEARQALDRAAEVLKGYTR